MFNGKVSIIMYHYVRDFNETIYKRIKGMDVDYFEKQIKHIINNYEVISMKQLLHFIDNKIRIKKNYAVLTFDDGYSDHYKFVFPILKKYNISGVFYIPTKTIKEGKALDVNKIHYILACESIDMIIGELKKQINKYRKTYKLKDYDYYFNKYAKPNRWDCKEVIFVKRMLQKGLEVNIRQKIINELFEKFVGQNEDDFSKKLYLSVEEIFEMQESGMEFGTHTHNHVWLNDLSKEEQQIEIVQSLEYLKEIGLNLKDWTMCYPYGAYDDNTIEILNKLGCKGAVTVEAREVDIKKCDIYQIPRLDCNDILVTNNYE